MKIFVRLILCILIIAGGVGIAFKMIKGRPAPERRPRPPVQTHVEATHVRAVDYTVTVRSQGEVQPRNETVLIPQVAGTVVEVASAFRDGGYFRKGDILLQIERADYESAITMAEAAVARARLQIDQENARAQQARRDWERLGKEGEPSDLLLRKPQVAEAKAALSSARAQLDKATRDLERTTLRAPYDGRVMEDQVDVGQYVSPGSRVGKIYAIDYVEIPLPLSDHQLSFVDVPEQAREGQAAQLPPVIVRAGDFAYTGRVVRTSGTVDSRSRQTQVVAVVDDPYAPGMDRPPLKVGMFVQAEIAGNVLRESLVLPQSAIREGRYVLLIDEDNRIKRQSVEVSWREKDEVIIGSGLKAGDVVCLTPVAYAVTGARVIPTIDGDLRMLEDQKPKKGPPSDAAGPGKKPGKSDGKKAEKGGQDSTSRKRFEEPGAGGPGK